MEAITLDVSAIGGLTDDEFFMLCASNKMLRMERTAQGEIMLLHPTGTGSGYRNSDLNAQLAYWNKRYRQGMVFDSSAGFTLPSGAVRSPDASFVLQERWDVLSEEQKEKFAPVCPDFIAELRSKNDSVEYLQHKIREEWLRNGCRLAWLIDPFDEIVYIYRQDSTESRVEGFDNTVSGEDVLPNFILELHDLR
ncbi:MAG: Uma2 family endonuclease [Candidatus Kapabacteria bacterium]|jgi:Uma2 family endonuclease|nr:Uma2 family endonuclease [Candidatus Kapabacteria bacterium]